MVRNRFGTGSSRFLVLRPGMSRILDRLARVARLLVRLRNTDESASSQEKLMLYKIARFLQLLGLLICPVGIAGNILRPEEVTLKDTLMIAAGGALVFTVGWLLQQTTKPR